MKKQRFILPRNVKYIISRLNSFGHRADIVGGSVRDALLGNVPYDYDITTSASPDELQEVFQNHRVVKTGLKHGTLTVILDDTPYEITTYRLDGAYTDNRHPDKVSFTKEIKEDLSRRDFTVNAMCYNENDGFTDLFSGIEDLEKRIIRAVGAPEERFSEDALRIMRALRFAAVLDFEIEEKTANAINKTAHLLMNISAERIFAEWKKLISGKGAFRIISEYSDVLKLVIPNLNASAMPKKEKFNKASSVLRELSLFDFPESYDEAMRALKSDNKRRVFGTSVFESMKLGLNSRVGIAHSLIAFGSDVTHTATELAVLRGELPDSAISSYDNLIKDGICYTLSELAIGGEELVKLGFGGKEIGEELNRILLLVAEGKLENERDKILNEVTVK